MTQRRRLWAWTRASHQYFWIITAITWIAAWPPRLLSQDRLGGWSDAFPANTMELVGVKEDSVGITLDLKNVSSKHITAFAVSRNDTVTDAIDFFEAEGDLEPEASYRLTISRQDQLAVDHVLYLTAAIFGDGTAVGVPDEIAEIRGRRLGLVVEIERLTGILNSADHAGVEAVKTRIGSLPNSLAEAVESLRGVQLPGVDIDYEVKSAGGRFPEGFLVGVRNAREAAAWKVDHLRQSPSQDDALFELGQLYKARSAKNRILVNQRGVTRQ